MVEVASPKRSHRKAAQPATSASEGACAEARRSNGLPAAERRNRSRVSADSSQALDAAFIANLVRLSPGFFTEQRTCERTSRLSADTAVLQTVLSYNLSEFARQTLFLLGGAVLLTMTHPKLAVTTLAVVPIGVGAAFLFGRMLRRASTGVQDRIAEATGTAEEAFSQIRTVQSFTRESEEIRRYAGHMAHVIAAAMDRARIRALFFRILTFCAFGAVVAVPWAEHRVARRPGCGGRWRQDRRAGQPCRSARQRRSVLPAVPGAIPRCKHTYRFDSIGLAGPVHAARAGKIFNLFPTEP